MKRAYYIFSVGKICRKENTIYFYQLPFSTNSTKINEFVTSDNIYENDKDYTQEEILTEIHTSEDKEIEKNLKINKKIIPIEDIESLYLFGNINFNSRFLNFLSSYNIPLHLFNYYGFYSGSFFPKEYLNSGFLLVKQVEKYLHTDKRMKIAQMFIDGASFNILKNLKYYSNRKINLKMEIETIETFRKDIYKTQNIQQLMGIEGNIRNCYYTTFKKILSEKYDFDERIKRPPNNIINTLISFANSILYTIVLNEIYHTQLNPLISFLHEPGERRFSLSLDISEIFKPIFCDRVIFKLLNNNILTEKHFENKANLCYLKEEGKKIFVQEFDSKMNTSIYHRVLKKNIIYKKLIRLECYKLIKHLIDDIEYKPFKIWW